MTAAGMARPASNGTPPDLDGVYDRPHRHVNGNGRHAAARLGVLPPGTTQRILDACRYIDVLVALCAVAGVFVLTNPDHPGAAGWSHFLNQRVSVKNLLLLASFAYVMHLSLKSLGVYKEPNFEHPGQYTLRLVAACLVGGLPLAVFPLASRTGAIQPVTVAYFLLAATGTIMALRGLLWIATAPAPAADVRNVLIVGSGPRAERLYRELAVHANRAIGIYGFVDSNHPPHTPEIAARMLGTLGDLEAILMRQVIDDVLITLPIKSRYGEIQNTIALCERLGVRAAYLADVFQSSLGRPSFELSGHFPVVRMHVATDDHRLVIKRTIDLLGGTIGLLIFSPLMIVIACAIKLTSRGPIIFRQDRIGLNKRRFSMYKFRTMVSDAEARQADLEGRNEASGPVFKISDDPRITRVGRLLRRTSLDELPQLVNVVRGDMSLVGPRPLPVRDVHRFAESYLMRRFSVPPGVTGLWQISGRSTLAFDRWVALDLEYIDSWSLALDLRILAKTVPAVLRGHGAT
jgi:exopolysaccharide biosynthesis polyprenyl glycosylphosphotransferase